MKKLLLILFVLSAGFSIANAQNDEKTHFGVKGGLNVANMTIDNAGSVNDKRSVLSYNAGVYGDFAIIPVLSVQPGLFISGKGSKYTIGDENSGTYVRVSSKPLYLELPVNLLLKIPVFNNVKIFAGAGPYIAAGIGGKNVTEGKLLDVDYKRDSKITYSSEQTGGSSANENLKRFDGGFNVLAGVELGKFTLDVNYGYGLVNIKPGTTNNEKYQNRVIAVQAGFIF
ncbi:MAG: PorT family protein [Sphingobacteriales bacterium]|nr:MAG: PorT family protein [Sphingobacteriales bacterium]